MNTTFPLLSDDVLTKIVNDMNIHGFGVAADCIDPSLLTSLRSFVENQVAENGGEYIALAGVEPVRGTFLEKLRSSPEFIRASKVIYEKGTGKTPPDFPSVPTPPMPLWKVWRKTCVFLPLRFIRCNRVDPGDHPIGGRTRGSYYLSKYQEDKEILFSKSDRQGVS